MRPRRPWDAFPDDPTPVTHLHDPKRTIAEAELQVARATCEDLREMLNIERRKNRDLLAQVRELELSNAQLRTALRKKNE